MKNKGKIIIANVLAGMLAFSFVATSCDGTTGGYVEEGTTVKFDYNDGQARPYSEIVDEGESVEAPAKPARKGYDFVGWTTKADGTGDTITFPYTPSADVTLYAKWTPRAYAVTFDMNYENDADIVVNKYYDETVEAPAASELPTRNGYEFYEWQDKAEGGAAVTFPYTVTDDVTFYAIWSTGGIFTINFDGNYDGAEEFDAERVMAGDDIKSRDLPKAKREGYDLVGWSFDQNATTEEECVEFPYEPTESGTLYAVWKMQEYSVGFRYNYVGKPEVTYQWIRGLHFGDSITAPETNPTRPGHTFEGWYTTAQGGTLVDFTQPVTKSATYYAHWKSDKVVTNTFHAEFTYIDPLENFPGYSGAATGCGIITGAGSTHTGLIYDPSDYPTNSAYTVQQAHFTTYLYKNGATLTFKIYAAEAVSGATLQANLAAEFVTGISVGPTGENAWKVKVNGAELNYAPITLGGELNSSNNSTPFSLHTIGNIDLVAGENTIELITANDNNIIGGTTLAFAPMVDCIKITGTSVELSYHPIYDNLWYSSLG